MVYFRSTIAVILIFAAMKSIAAVSLQDVRFSELPGGRFEMRADFSARKPCAYYFGFAWSREPSFTKKIPFII